MSHFKVIQGGMGVGVSGWRLANAVARLGQLGVVSGTGLAITLARWLQLGDPEGVVRRALDAFPLPEVVGRAMKQYFIPGGKPADAPFKLTPMPQVRSSRAFVELTVLANFVEVFLAKEGHCGVVGINYLEKIQIPTLPSLYGAMLADADYVLIGAGVPRFIPGALDSLSQGKATTLAIDVHGAAPDEQTVCTFDPDDFCGGAPPVLRRPRFFAIISSATLAITLARKSNGQVDGFVVEGSTAGGHNAPPRGPMQLSIQGEPIYGPRDTPELAKIGALGLPFYLAGGFAEPTRLAEARQAGAAGVQIGTAFAFCEESGITSQLKTRVIAASRWGQAQVRTDPCASPTGFPFKVLQLGGTVSDPDVLRSRPRVCDLGYLRQPYRKPDGSVGYRCPGEPVDQYVGKGGDVADTHGRICLCNSLCATVGFAQMNATGQPEPPLLTAGDDVARLARFLRPGHSSYTAADVLAYVLNLEGQVHHGIA
jgi:NAD(P)H-dependent flavin oxidoreductase YrpB (nitropropane dioxygenase family)